MDYIYEGIVQIFLEVYAAPSEKLTKDVVHSSLIQWAVDLSFT